MKTRGRVTKPRILLALLVAGTLLAVVAFAMRPHPAVALNDGTLVRLHSVTRGTNHIARFGNPFQRLLTYASSQWLERVVPGGLKKHLSGMGKASRTTETNAVLVWLEFLNGKGMLRYAIGDADGIGGEPIHYNVVARSAGEAAPVTLNVWPKSAEKISIKLFTNNGREYLGRLVIENPARSEVKRFEARPLPAREGAEELELTLERLEVRQGGATFASSAGNYWASRAFFTVRENGKTNQDWMVQTMRLTDAGGNTHRATGPRKWNGEMFEMYSHALFTTEGAWKVEADLTRSANFPAEEIVTFVDVPMPSNDGPAETVFRTNLLGHTVILRSMKKAQVKMEDRPGHHGMGGPGFAVELEPRVDEWVPRVAAIFKENGEAVRVPNHGYGVGYSLFRFNAPEGSEPPRTLRVQVTAQERKRFTFFADPSVVE